MRNGYIPKDQRKKILLLSDEMRLPSGVGVMSREMVEQTAHHYNWVQLGAATTHPEVGKIIDVSGAVSEKVGIPDASVFIYPNNGYGDSRLLNKIVDRESPDAIMIFTDPRYWIWLFQVEHEIRQKMPILYLNIWDDLPDPKYNRNFYRSCDALFAISKQTFGINYRVVGKDNIVILPTT